MNKKLYYIFLAVVFVLIILYRLLGTQGKAVLIGTAFFGLALIILGSFILWILMKKKNSETIQAIIVMLAFGIVLIGYGFYSELNVVRDMKDGPQIAEMNNCYITSRSGIHGILGYQNYLIGTSRSGETLRFPISFSGRDEVEGISYVIVEYYEHIGRIINIQ